MVILNSSLSDWLLWMGSSFDPEERCLSCIYVTTWTSQLTDKQGFISSGKIKIILFCHLLNTLSEFFKIIVQNILSTI